MKTLKQVTNERPELTELIRAVVRNVGKESITDINNHGIDGGFNGFIYTRDTVDFYHKHKEQILKLIEEMADSCGEDFVSMVANFNCLKDQKYKLFEVVKALESKAKEINSKSAPIQNAVVWFAAEEVCRMFEN